MVIKENFLTPLKIGMYDEKITRDYALAHFRERINIYMEKCKNCKCEAHCPETCMNCKCKKCDCSICDKPRPKVKTGDEIVQ